ncbi:MAG: sensor histidine kinase, partial [Bacteroidota bacterium]
MNAVLVISVSVAYLLLLFLIAFLTERAGRAGKSLVNNPLVYALSLAVFCTAWTFFGSVGKASNSGIDFLPTYLGPTLAAVLWWLVLRKIILISKSQRITSIADFISSRYGKSRSIGALVTIMSIFCVIPYISIQLKAVTFSYDILVNGSMGLLLPFGETDSGNAILDIPFYQDTAWYIAIVLALFSILFGTRNLDPNERHEGLVAAVAFESLFKLMAFLAIGLFVVFGLFNGFGDLFAQARSVEDVRAILYLPAESSVNPWYWFWLMLLSMMAIVLLPRQFHIAVVENTNPDFVRQASWIFPLYLLVINIFVLPIAIGGMLLLGPEANPDGYVLSLPIAEGNNWLALFVALGGFSASTSMVIVAITALSIMFSNHLVTPLLLNPGLLDKRKSVEDLSGRLVAIRQISVVMILIIAYGYFKFVSAKYTLVSIGLISFAGVAQFAPALFIGLYWKQATKAGAFYGLLAGFLVWAFCLPVATLAEVGIISDHILSEGLWGISWLKPYALFGFDGTDPISHGAFWSLLVNTLIFVWVSLFSKISPEEISQADLFVNIQKYIEKPSDFEVIKRTARFGDIRNILIRFLGPGRTTEFVQRMHELAGNTLPDELQVDEEIIGQAEIQLAGAIGASSARITINSITRQEPISLQEMLKVLDQTKEIMQYSKELEQKSNDLEVLTTELRNANEQLKALDKLKADFITTVTHELRTPITAIKSLAAILKDHPELPEAQQAEYLHIVVNESSRVARLVNQVLDLEKIQQQKNQTPKYEFLDLNQIARKAFQSFSSLFHERNIEATEKYDENQLLVSGNQDQLTQAIVNLVSNAIKFCDSNSGIVQIETRFHPASDPEENP